MNSESNRSYRKNLITNGLIYMNGEELQVSVINMSMTGMLVQLNNEGIYASNVEKALDGASTAPTIIDFYLPQLRLAGTAEIVRVNRNEPCISLALKFKDITYNIDNLLYKRKVYRKDMSIIGKILLNNQYHGFHTVNVSVEGLMIRLAKTADMTVGMITTFEFKNLNLKGEVEVIWLEADDNGNTLAGLKYIHINADKIIGIPRFSVD